MLSDYQVHVLGVPDNPALGAPDPGAEQRFAFRTPSLRNLAHHRAVHARRDLRPSWTPWSPTSTGDPAMVEESIRCCSRSPSSPNGNFITAFLATLNGTFDRSIPPRVPSGLPPGGR